MTFTSNQLAKQVWLRPGDLGQCNPKESAQIYFAKMGLLGWLWGQRSREGSRKVHFDQEVTNMSTREKTSSLVVAREKPRFWLTRLWLRFLRHRRKDERQRDDSISNQGYCDSWFAVSFASSNSHTRDILEHIINVVSLFRWVHISEQDTADNCRYSSHVTPEFLDSLWSQWQLLSFGEPSTGIMGVALQMQNHT